MTELNPATLRQLLALVDRDDFRPVVAAHALGARARLASDPGAAMAWAALPARSLPDDLPAEVRSAWVFVVRRGRSAGCHMHPNSIQRTITFEGSGTLLVGAPESPQPVSLTDRRDAPLEERACAIEAGTFHDAAAGDQDWVSVSFHTVPADALAEVEYGAEEGTSAGFAQQQGAPPSEIRLDLRCRRETIPYPRLPLANEFGQIFTGNMFRMSYTQERGWSGRKLTPLAPLPMHPGTSALHYGQQVFEGLKAHRQPDGALGLFRPDAHAHRMRASCERLAMPPVEPGDFLAAVRGLVELDQGRLPVAPEASLYLRPILFGTNVGLGVHESSEYLFLVMACVVGSYRGISGRPLRVLASSDQVRAVSGGTGAAKTAGNYAAALLGERLARERGFDQVLWLDALQRREIEEMGAMNFFVAYDRHLVTPPLGGTILPGVTRDSIIRLAPSLGLTVEERPLPLAEVLADAQAGKITEAFGCGTAASIAPVGEIASASDRASFAPIESPVARQLADALAGIRGGRAPDPHGWVVRAAHAPP